MPRIISSAALAAALLAPLGAFAQTATDTAAKKALPTLASATSAEECETAYWATYVALREQPAAEQKQATDKMHADLATCAARFEKAAQTPAALLKIASMYSTAQSNVQAWTFYDRAITIATGAERGKTIKSALDNMLPYDRGISADELMIAEKWAVQVDSLGQEAAPSKAAVHSTLSDSYAETDAKMSKHADAALTAARAMTAEQRDAEKGAYYEAFVAAAAAQAVQWKFDKAVTILREAIAQFPADTGYEHQTVATRVHQYSMVGQPAPKIAIAAWINATTAPGNLDFAASKVTVIQFTNTACGICKQAYPTMSKLSKTFAESGARPMLVSAFFGKRFGGPDGDVTRPEELEFDKSVWLEKDAVDIPIALAEGAGPQKESWREPYGVYGIPMYYFVDRAGIVRYAHWRNTRNLSNLESRFSAVIKKIQADDSHIQSTGTR